MEDRLLQKLQGNITDRVPAWFLRQAGRYLPEYLALRSKVKKFTELCYNSDLITEISLMPINRFDLDAAIVFSDILVVPDVLGMDLDFIPNQGPVFRQALKTPKDFDKFINQDLDVALEQLKAVFSGLKQIKSAINKKALLGFCGSPWTIACYLFKQIDAKVDKDWSSVRKLLFMSEYENSWHKLMQFLSEFIIKFANQQLKSGADAIVIFDSWGGVLGINQYKTWVLPYLLHINKNIKTSNQILYIKQASHLLGLLKQTKFNSMCFDWTVDLSVARKILGNNIILQGNFDPALLFSSKNQIKQAVIDFKNNLDINNNYILNLGHGVLPLTPIDKLEYLQQQFK